LAYDIPIINKNGQTAFLAGLDGSKVTDANDRAIVAQDVNGSLRLIALEGDLIEVAPGDARQISTLRFLGSGTEDFRELQTQSLNNGFNDRGEIIFVATFTDGTSGVFLSSLVAIPEPATPMLILSSLAVLSTFRSGGVVGNSR
jgi:hypothetical protein